MTKEYGKNLKVSANLSDFLRIGGNVGCRGGEILAGGTAKCTQKRHERFLGPRRAEHMRGDENIPNNIRDKKQTKKRGISTHRCVNV